jgi:hypothetical protein
MAPRWLRDSLPASAGAPVSQALCTNGSERISAGMESPLRTVARGDIIIMSRAAGSLKRISGIYQHLQHVPVHVEIGQTARCVIPHTANMPAGIIDEKTGQLHSTRQTVAPVLSLPSVSHAPGKMRTSMILAADVADLPRHLRDFLPGHAHAADERRAEFSRPYISAALSRVRQH